MFSVNCCKSSSKNCGSIHSVEKKKKNWEHFILFFLNASQLQPNYLPVHLNTIKIHSFEHVFNVLPYLWPVDIQNIFHVTLTWKCIRCWHVSYKFFRIFLDFFQFMLVTVVDHLFVEDWHNHVVFIYHFINIFNSNLELI